MWQIYVPKHREFDEPTDLLLIVAVDANDMMRYDDTKLATMYLAAG